MMYRRLISAQYRHTCIFKQFLEFTNRRRSASFKNWWYWPIASLCSQGQRSCGQKALTRRITMVSGSMNHVPFTDCLSPALKRLSAPKFTASTPLKQTHNENWFYRNSYRNTFSIQRYHFEKYHPCTEEFVDKKPWPVASLWSQDQWTISNCGHKALTTGQPTSHPPFAGQSNLTRL